MKALIMRFARFAAFSFAGVMLVAMPAMAVPTLESSTFYFTSDHCTGGCLPTGAANMGTVTVSETLVANTFDVSVQLATGFGFVHTGAGTGTDGSAAFFFRLFGNPTITYSNVTTGWVIPNVIPVNQQAAGSYAGGALADEFEYALECYPGACGNGGSSPAPSPLNFTVFAAGLSLADFNDPGTSGSPIAADVISTTGNTGLIDASVCQFDCGGGNTNVPEPSTILLMGGGLLGLAYWRKRKSA